MKKKRGREDESYNISEIMSKEVKIKGEGHIMFYVVYNLCDIDNYYLKGVLITDIYVSFQPVKCFREEDGTIFLSIKRSWAWPSEKLL